MGTLERKIKIIVFLFLNVLLFTGCTSSYVVENDINTTPNNHEVILLEVEDIKNKPDSSFITESLLYTLRLDVSKSLDDDLINISVILDEPKKVLNEIKITFLLNDELVKYFYTNQLYFSNEWTNLVSLVPDGEMKGINVSKTVSPLPSDHLYSEGSFRKEKFIDLIADTRVKVTWTDEQENKNVEYLILSKNSINIDEKVFLLFN